MKKVKQMTWLIIIISVLMIIQGIFFLAKPIESSSVAISLLAVLFLVVGIMDIYTHFKYKTLDVVFNRNGAILGLLEIVIAIFMFTQKAVTAAMFSYLFSIYILFTGISMCEYSLTLKKVGVEGWLMLMVFSIILIIDAVIMIFSPVQLAFETLTMWIALSLIFTGASLLVSVLRFKGQVTKYDTKVKQFLADYNNSFYA